MSRFKLFGIMQAMMLSVMANPKLTSREKQAEVSSINKQSGGLLFASGISPNRTLNQRQIRKRRRQNPNSRKWAA